MNPTSHGSNSGARPLRAAQFDALIQKVDRLSQCSPEHFFRFKAARGTSDIDVVPAKPRQGQAHRSDTRARYSIALYLKAQRRVYGADNTATALKAVMALPPEFKAKDAHLALRTLSREDKRAWLSTTADGLMACSQALLQDPWALDRIDRPGAHVHGVRDRVEQALAWWCQALAAEVGPAAPEGEGEPSAVVLLWAPLFQACFGASERTAALTLRTLRLPELSAPHQQIYARHDELVAQVQAVRGRPGSQALNQRTLQRCRRVIEAVSSCIGGWVELARGLERLARATPDGCDARQGQAQTERQREIFLHLACCLIDRCCVVLDPREGPMKILRYALDCQSAAQLWAERVNAHAAMRALQRQIGRLPKRAPAAPPDAAQCQRADRAYAKACELAVSAEQAFCEAFLPGEGQAPWPADSPQATALEALQKAFERDELTRLVEVSDPLQALFERPWRSIHAAFACHEDLREEQERSDPSPEHARERRENCHRIVELYAPLVARLATAVPLFVDAAAGDGLSRQQQSALVGFARALSALARAVLDPASSFRAFYVLAQEHLAQGPDGDTA